MVVRRQGSHFFQAIGSQMVVRLSTFCAGRTLHSFLIKMNRLQDHCAAGRIRALGKFNDLVGIRSRDFTFCSTVPQSTTPPRAPNILLNMLNLLFCAL
jgi:hypothetical protein